MRTISTFYFHLPTSHRTASTFPSITPTSPRTNKSPMTARSFKRSLALVTIAVFQKAVLGFDSPVNPLLGSDDESSSSEEEDREETGVREMTAVAVPRFNIPVNHIIDIDKAVHETKVEDMPAIATPTYSTYNSSANKQGLPVEVIFVNQFPGIVSGELQESI
jgi:hypothetical protein